MPHFGEKGQKYSQHKDAKKFKGVSVQLEECKNACLTAMVWLSSTQIINGTADWPLFLSGVSLTSN